MQRLKIPGGVLTGRQWKTLAGIARDLTPTAPLHMTTRQDIEFHDIAAGNVGDVQREIARAGLTCAGACGDTLRNITVCPGSKWCSRALVDTNGIADRIRAELGGALPAENVVCVSGCPNGCAHSRAAHIGLTGALVNRDGRRSEAYDIYAAGSMGVDSTLAKLVARRLDAKEAIAEVVRLARTGASSKSKNV